MSRLEYASRMAWGWVAFHILTTLHLSIYSRVGWKLLPHAGFYAYDDGYPGSHA